MGSTSPEEVKTILENFSQMTETVMIIDGNTLQLCLDNCRTDFWNYTRQAPVVVCCRCSPTQKAEVVETIKMHAKNERIAAIGDGGNDVSMIQAALAADYSISQFSHVAQLFLWHGRNSYQRSAAMSQVIIHRGMVISFIQAIFCAVFFMSPVTIYTGMLVFGYSCWYTMLPVFSLVVDEDIDKKH